VRTGRDGLPEGQRLEAGGTHRTGSLYADAGEDNCGFCLMAGMEAGWRQKIAETPQRPQRVMLSAAKKSEGGGRGGRILRVAQDHRVRENNFAR
jgi:hypothetical protein